MAAKATNVTRVRIAREELDKMSKEQLQKCWNLQEQYVDLLENRLQSNSEHTELMNLRESEEKLKQQQIDASRRENILVMRLTTKEHEMQEFAGQIQELKQAQVPTIAQLRSSMLDPAVNLLFEKMKKEVDTLKAKLREMQDEFNAWKFTPDSNTGKRLMAKCRLLYQENEDLGKIISSGRMAKLEGDLALQKSFSEEMKKSQAELDQYLLEVDEEVDGMGSTIIYLQQQLREAKEQIAQLQKDKLEQSGISNGLSPLSNSVNISDNKRKSPMLQMKSENGQPSVNQPSHIDTSIKNEINGTESMNLKTEIFSEEEELHSPVKDCLDLKAGEKPQLTNSVLSVSKEVISKEPQTLVLGAIAQSVIVENKSSVNHEKQVPLVERTNLIVDATDSSDSIHKRTNDQMHDDKPAEKGALDVPKDTSTQQPQKANKRTSDSGRNRKRTRPRTPDSIKEESLPVRKRTRRREAEMLSEAIEESRTPVEIDTDTEVQVAETLASWAATKQERTELKTELEDVPLGNGEISRMDEDK